MSTVCLRCRGGRTSRPALIGLSPGLLRCHVHARPTPYEDSLCQETHSSCERIVRIVFRVPGPGAVDRRSRVRTCLPCTGAHAACGTTPVLRRGHPLGREGSAPLGGPLRPPHAAVPSSRPLPRAGCAW